MNRSPRASIVIPAHNEAQGIVRTLSTLLADAYEGEFDVLVVCNGCTDDTAERARSIPQIAVREIDTASKIAALSEGDRCSEVFPRIYLDADVLLTTDAARAMADALKGGDALVAGIPGRYDLRQATPLVGLFYEFRQRLPVFADGIIGAGVYAMSAEGRARFGEWPEVLGDDQFVYRLFSPDERVVLRGHHTVVEPAADLRMAVRRGVRVRRGNDQLGNGTGTHLPLPPPPAGLVDAVRCSFASPRGLASVLVFIGVTLVTRFKVRVSGDVDWGTPQPSDVTPATHPAVPPDPRPVTAVVVTFNAAAHVDAMLRSVRASSGDRLVEVVAVDNGSSDETVDLLRAEHGVRLIQQENVGYAGGVNRGLEAAVDGSDILILNPDVTLRPETIEQLAQVLEARPAAGIVVPRLQDESGRTLPSLRRDPTVFRTLVEATVGGSRAGRFGEAYAPMMDAGLAEVDWATGAVMLIRHEMVSRIGLMDERFFLYSEETEYCMRAREAGYAVVCRPDAVAQHLGGEMSRNQHLWALRAVNRVRLHRAWHGGIRTVSFRTASLIFEFRRAISGHRVSFLAVRLLVRPSIDRSAQRLIATLGGSNSG